RGKTLRPRTQRECFRSSSKDRDDDDALKRAAGGSPMSELFISFVGEDLETTQISAVATPVVLGTDGELPMRLPVSDSRPQLYLESEAEIGGANLLFAPVPPRSPWADPSLTLRLIAHMRLNRLPVVPGGTSPDTLRSMLELYDFDGEGSARNRRLRESLHSVRSRVANARVEGEISRGLEVELEIDNEAVPDRETFLLASVLERVLPDLCSINSFVATSLRIRGHEELTKAWPPRTGTRVLI
ncbi:MAG: type VI secretion system baseplate subunit TssF, partial [Planctomycetota bacterium]